MTKNTTDDSDTSKYI